MPVLRQDVASYEMSVEKAELEAKRKRVADAELKWLQVRGLDGVHDAGLGLRAVGCGPGPGLGPGAWGLGPGAGACRLELGAWGLWAVGWRVGGNVQQGRGGGVGVWPDAGLVLMT